MREGYRISAHKSAQAPEKTEFNLLRNPHGVVVRPTGGTKFAKTRAACSREEWILDLRGPLLLGVEYSPTCRDKKACPELMTLSCGRRAAASSVYWEGSVIQHQNQPKS
jgi:hypothetical protein